MFRKSQLGKKLGKNASRLIKAMVLLAIPDPLRCINLNPRALVPVQDCDWAPTLEEWDGVHPYDGRDVEGVCGKIFEHGACGRGLGGRVTCEG